ncbi:O-antigen polymerase [Dysgonomonas hofstadii]|uniref:O-antigen polymerase n=1 Tax=Dysgonomonas hofstadii TaxID=637886 RepID=UPI0016187D8A|nr:O-antigen polymerase [Dysgonomonas hofstadii]
MTGNTILILNASVYTLTLLIYYIRSKSFNVGVFLLLLYSVAAWSSVLYYNHKLFIYSYSYSSITVEPFIYLYVVLMLFLYPFLKFKTNEILKIEAPNKRKMLLLIKILTILQLFIILIQLPNVADIITSANWGELRNSQYDLEYKFWFSSIPIVSRFYGLVAGILPISIVLSFYFYFIDTYKNKWQSWFFYSTIIVVVLNQIVVAGRGSLLLFIVYIFSVFLLFYKKIPERKRKLIIKLSVVPIAIFIVFFVSVSQSRFGDAVSFETYRYAGESMINFNGKLYYELKDSTNGNAYFVLLTNIFDRDNAFKTVIEKWNYIENITGVDAHYFYTFIGAFLLEFGKIITFLIAIIFCIISSWVLRKNKTTTLPIILYYSIWGYMFSSGIFFFNLQNATGNFTIILLIFLMFYLKNKNAKKIYYENRSSYLSRSR